MQRCFLTSQWPPTPLLCLLLPLLSPYCFPLLLHSPLSPSCLSLMTFFPLTPLRLSFLPASISFLQLSRTRTLQYARCLTCSTGRCSTGTLCLQRLSHTNGKHSECLSIPSFHWNRRNSQLTYCLCEGKFLQQAAAARVLQECVHFSNLFCLVGVHSVGYSYGGKQNTTKKSFIH